MITEAFAYAMAIALLVGLAAASVEQLLAEIKRPRRLAWLGAYAVALGFPLLALLLAANTPAPLAERIGAAPEGVSAAYSAIDWNSTLLWLWAASTTLLLIAYATAWLRLALLARRWSRAATDATSLVVVADDVGPAVLGILNARIVLPRWLMDTPEAFRSTVVAHELEHVAARDQALIVAAHLVTVLLPWNLPLWWFAKRLRAAIEIDCDARVLRNGVDPAHYADVLLAVGQHRAASPYVAATLIEPVTQLERRIRIMLTSRQPSSARRAATAAVLAAALAACASGVEPPVLTARAGQADDDAAVSSVVLDAGEVVAGPDGQVTVFAGEILVRVGTADQMRIRAERVTTTNDGALFEGDVRIDSDRTSITASRARTERAAGGEMVLTVEDATVVRTFAEPPTSSE